MRNKRAFTRVEVPPSSRIGASVVLKGAWYRGRLKDISLHGMFIALRGDIPVEAEVAVTLWLGDNP